MRNTPTFRALGGTKAGGGVDVGEFRGPLGRTGGDVGRIGGECRVSHETV